MTCQDRLRVRAGFVLGSGVRWFVTFSGEAKLFGNAAATVPVFSVIPGNAPPSPVHVPRNVQRSAVI